MNKFSWVSALTLSTVVAMTGCDTGDTDDVWIDEQAESYEEIPELRDHVIQGMRIQGMRLQGMRLQGLRLQGVSLQGINIQGVRLQGIRLQGLSVQGISVQGSSLSGVVGGEELSAEELVGAEMDVYFDVLEAEYTMRIDDVYKDPSNPEGDVYFYQITYLDPETQEWKPTCEDHENNESIAMAGAWDDTGARVEVEGLFSFSCRNAVAAKCVEWGYRPWAEQEGESLASYHQACTRMARADYCGDGTPHTLEGVTIDIEDQLDTSLQTFESWWPYEAEWNEDGAVCVRPWNLRLWLTGEAYPSCMYDIEYIKKCGWDPQEESLLVNRFSFFYNWWQLNNN